MGLFAKENGKLEYRLSYNKPFATNLVPTNDNSRQCCALTTAETQNGQKLVISDINV
jgi:hypothetical protein